MHQRCVRLCGMCWLEAWVEGYVCTSIYLLVVLEGGRETCMYVSDILVGGVPGLCMCWT